MGRASPRPVDESEVLWGQADPGPIDDSEVFEQGRLATRNEGLWSWLALSLAKAHVLQ